MTKEQLKEWRDTQGLTQRKAAEKLGITQSAYVALEKGISYKTGKPTAIDRRTELACLAISQGLASEEEKFGALD
jgi:DNA-binding XRE family transcriptional regulator